MNLANVIPAKMLPSKSEIMREALIVMAGAMLAALVVNMLPPKFRKMFSLPTSNSE